MININDKFDAKEMDWIFHSYERMTEDVEEKHTWFSLVVFRVCQLHVDDRMMLDNHFRVYLISVLIPRNQPETTN